MSLFSRTQKVHDVAAPRRRGRRRSLFAVLGLLALSAAEHAGATAGAGDLAREAAHAEQRSYAPVELSAQAPEPAPPVLRETIDSTEVAELARRLETLERSGLRAGPPDQVLAFEASDPLQAVSPNFLGAGFNGLTPADTTLGKSPQRILQAVNSQIRLFGNDGSLLASKSLAAFLGTDNVPRAPFDPRILFDRLGPNQRFYVVATEQKPTEETGLPPRSTLFLSVSRSTDPPSLDPAHWCTYRLWSQDDYSGSGNPTFADFPTIGVGVDAFVISSVYRRNVAVDPPFTYTIVEAFEKLSLSQNSSSCPIAISQLFRPADSAGDEGVLFLQPAHHITAPSSFAGTANPVYLISARPRNSDVTEYRLWRLRNIADVATLSNLQQITVQAQPFTLPPFALQPGTTTRVVTNDCRVAAATGLGDLLWFVMTVRCNAGGGADEACIRAVQLSVGQSAGSPTAAVLQEITFGGGPNVFFYMPGLAVNPARRVMVPFLTSSASQRQSFAWTAQNANQAKFQSAQTLMPGLCNLPPIDPQRANFQRAGDYVGAALDPASSSSFWVSGEHAAQEPSGSTVCTWRSTFHTLP